MPSRKYGTPTPLRVQIFLAGLRYLPERAYESPVALSCEVVRQARQARQRQAA